MSGLEHVLIRHENDSKGRCTMEWTQSEPGLCTEREGWQCTRQHA